MSDSITFEVGQICRNRDNGYLVEIVDITIGGTIRWKMIDGQAVDGLSTDDVYFIAESVFAECYVLADDDDIEEHNEEILSEWFKQCEEWSTEYVQSDDYVGEYAYLMSESDRINQSVRRLLNDWEIPENTNRHQLADDLATRILNDGLFDHNIVDEYSSESCGYLDSFQVGEYEDQIEVSRIREDIEDKLIGDFFDVLQAWIENQRDFCIRSWGSQHLRNQKYPTVYLITYTGLRIDYVIDDEQLEELLEEMTGSVKGGAA